MEATKDGMSLSPNRVRRTRTRTRAFDRAGWHRLRINTRNWNKHSFHAIGIFGSVSVFIYVFYIFSPFFGTMPWYTLSCVHLISQGTSYTSRSSSLLWLRLAPGKWAENVIKFTRVDLSLNCSDQFFSSVCTLLFAQNMYYYFFSLLLPSSFAGSLSASFPSLLICPLHTHLMPWIIRN